MSTCKFNNDQGDICDLWMLGKVVCEKSGQAFWILQHGYELCVIDGEKHNFQRIKKNVDS